MPVLTAIDETPIVRQGNRWVPKEEYKDRNQQQRLRNKFNTHQFLCFDGEGFAVNERHEYCYLAAYNGESVSAIRNDAGLSSLQCFQFIAREAARHPKAICIIYGGSYDSNMMLRDVPYERLCELRENGHTRWRGWRIEYVPWKYFQVSHKRLGIGCRIWDVIGFFQSSFQVSIEKWLGIKSSVINKGKAKRSKFTADDMENIIAYCHEELKYFEQLAQHLWECLNGVDIQIRRWDGAGAIAQALLSNHDIYKHKGSVERQEEHYYLARCAYAGGRFENFMPGDFEQSVYGYDINSAYPFAISQLAPFSQLIRCRKRNHIDCVIGPYDLLAVAYETDISIPIHPYFHRGDDLSISYPNRHVGWHWSPEYLAALHYGDAGDILEHYIWRDNGRRPFSWVADKYEERLEMKHNGDPKEKVIKLGLNSLYGKLAQQRGWREGQSIPRFHQLYWAGWITAKCRSMVYSAMMQAPESIIACETDGIISMMPLSLPIGKGLGEWEFTEYEWITYVQSGLYFAGKEGQEVKLRSRGINAKSVSRKAILQGWSRYYEKPSLASSFITTRTKRFHTLASSIATNNMEDWRQWKEQKKKISLIPTQTGKRAHIPTICGTGCEWGLGHYHRTLARPMTNEVSAPYEVLWEDDDGSLAELYLARDIEKEESIINE